MAFGSDGGMLAAATHLELVGQLVRQLVVLEEPSVERVPLVHHDPIVQVGDHPAKGQ